MKCVFPGRWVGQTRVTHVGRLIFYLQALSAPGGSGGAVFTTKSGKMVGFIGGAYDVQELESTNSKKLVDRRFDTYAFSVHALPRRLSSAIVRPLESPQRQQERTGIVRITSCSAAAVFPLRVASSENVPKLWKRENYWFFRSKNGFGVAFVGAG